MATHSGVLAWRIPGTGEPGGLPSVGLHRVRHDWSDLAVAAYIVIIYIDHILYNVTKFTYKYAAAAAAKSLQSCPTLCDPIDSSPPGSAVPGILQARTLEWVAISYSSTWKWKVKGKWLSRVRLLATPWTAAHQAPPSMGFSRQEYWSGVLLLWVVLNRLFYIVHID